MFGVYQVPALCAVMWTLTVAQGGLCDSRLVWMPVSLGGLQLVTLLTPVPLGPCALCLDSWDFMEKCS